MLYTWDDYPSSYANVLYKISSDPGLYMCEVHFLSCVSQVFDFIMGI